MSGGKEWIQQQAQQVPVHMEEESSLHGIYHVIIESGVGWWVIGFALIGIAGVFKDRIKKWLRS